MGLEDQFRASLYRRSAPIPSSHSLLPDRLVKSQVGREAFNLAFRAIAREFTARSLYHLRDLVAACESPIEETMLYALCVLCHRNAASVQYILGDRVFGDLDQSRSSFRIQPQAHIEDFRVDFLITYVDLGDYVEISRNNIPTTRTIRQMVIECDGHEYHSRTKEQAMRDRQRDRVLQRNGYKVFRYTGSEIWSDVFKCAEEAIDTLCRKNSI